MRRIRTALFAAAGVLAVAGFAGAAAAEMKNAHVLTVRLPDGSIEQIRYSGDTPPQVTMTPALASIADPFGPDSAFAQMQAMSAAMNQRAAAMLQQAMRQRAAVGAIGPDGLMSVDLGKLPAGANGVYMVATTAGNGVCARSVQYTAYGDGRKPQVITRTSGDCGAAGERASPTALPPAEGAAPANAPIQARLDTAARPDPSLVRLASATGN